MKKQIQLSIPTPCHEDWDKMNPVEKGKFCDSCQKKVIDFTQMSDREIALFFKRPSPGSTCGRFMQDQLDRNIEIPKKRIPWLKYFSQILIPGYLLSCNEKPLGKTEIHESKIEATSKQTFSETVGMIASEIVPDTAENFIAGDIEVKSDQDSETIVPDTTTSAIVGDVEERINGDNISELVTITGKVIDENGEPIPNANIEALDRQWGTSTDTVGRFTIQKNTDDSIQLNVSAVGYQTKHVNVTQTDPNYEFVVQLGQDVKPLSEVVVNSSIGRHMLGALSVCRFTREKSSVQISAPANRLMKVYPNPISRGSSITVDVTNENAEPLQLRIIGVNGELLASQTLNGNRGRNQFAVQTDSRWSAGIYFIQLSDKTGKSVKKEKLIIQ